MPLDRLPDEILERILDHVLAHDGPFFLANCTAPEGVIHYPDEDTVRRVMPADHDSAHLSDWRLVSGTSRRIRRIGKWRFFAVKRIVLTFATLARLARRTFSPLSMADQDSMLQSTREIAILDNHTSSGSRMLILPNHLKAFPRLRRCVLLFGYALSTHPQVAYQALVRHYDAPDKEKVARPERLSKLLAAIGLPSAVKLEVTTASAAWSQYEAKLEQNVYPILEFKARALAK